MLLKCIILFYLSYSFTLAQPEDFEETEMTDGAYVLDILEEMMIDDNVVLSLWKDFEEQGSLTQSGYVTCKTLRERLPTSYFNNITKLWCDLPTHTSIEEIKHLDYSTFKHIMKTVFLKEEGIKLLALIKSGVK